MSEQEEQPNILEKIETTVLGEEATKEIKEVIDITKTFKNPEEVGIEDIRNIGKKYFEFIKKSGYINEFKEGNSKVVIDFIAFSASTFLENDEAFEAFEELFKEITGINLKEIKGSDLQTAINHTFDFVKEINLSGFFSNMTTMFTSMIKG